MDGPFMGNDGLLFLNEVTIIFCTSKCGFGDNTNFPVNIKKNCKYMYQLAVGYEVKFVKKKCNLSSSVTYFFLQLGCWELYTFTIIFVNKGTIFYDEFIIKLGFCP